MKKLLIPLVVLLLVGCAGKNAIPPAEGLRLSCEGFTSELKILAPLRANGTLSAKAIGVVDTQKAATDKICDTDAPAVDASVGKVSVDAGTQVLLSIAAQFIK